MKDGLNLLHRNGVVRNDFFVSTISAVFERVEVWLHELLMGYLNYNKVNAYIINTVKKIRFSLRKKLINLKISKVSFFLENGKKINFILSGIKLAVFKTIYFISVNTLINAYFINLKTPRNFNIT